MSTQENLIPVKELRTMQIIVIAVPAGAALFSIIVLAMGNATSQAAPVTDSSLPVMRIVHLALTLYVLAISKFLAKKVLSGKMKMRTNVVGQEQTFVQRYRSALIIQLALTEGCVLFGGVIFLIASTAGAVRTDPSYYFHFLPLLFFLVQAKILYPTEEKYVMALQEYESAAI